jgi:hypothetical protein
MQIWSQNPIPACDGDDFFIQKWLIKRQICLDSACYLYSLKKFSHLRFDLQNPDGYYAACGGR